MKRVIHFTRSFKVTVPISIILIILGLVGWAFKGFNNGVDFQAGLNTSVQIVPQAIGLTYAGQDTYRLSMTKQSISILIQKRNGESKNYPFTFAQYPTVKSLSDGLKTVPDLQVQQIAKDEVPSTKLISSTQKDPVIAQTPIYVHNELVSKDEIFAPIAKVREATASLGSASIQSVGDPLNQEFMVRIEDPGKDPQFSKTITAKLVTALEGQFGAEKVVVNRTDFVGAAFSKDLVRSALWLTIATFALILIYCAFRFRIDYAVGAILSVIHDALIMVCFIVWTRMEFDTQTIAAILTIIGYSIMDTIVIYDRIREKQKMLPDASFKDCLDMGVTETLSRTIITSGTTLLSVLALMLFTTGSLKNFAIALFVGIISGTYSSTFIASAFVEWWRHLESKHEKKGQGKNVRIPAIKPKQTEA
jgi:preprotein translocase subunit SecF